MICTTRPNPFTALCEKIYSRYYVSLYRGGYISLDISTKPTRLALKDLNMFRAMHIICILVANNGKNESERLAIQLSRAGKESTSPRFFDANNATQSPTPSTGL